MEFSGIQWNLWNLIAQFSGTNRGVELERGFTVLLNLSGCF